METLPIVTKEDYYKDAACISYSSLKVFSKCETLYRDIFVSKTYEEPDHDYFTYGKLVDAMISEPPQFIVDNFVRVERRIRPEDALSIENKIKILEGEIAEKRTQIAEKISAKCQAIRDKIVALPEGSPKILKLEADFQEAALTPDKTLEKGIAGRLEQIAALQASFDLIKQYADKIQVTEALWLNAEETAQAIKAHPSFVSMEWNGITSQQIFRSLRGGIPRKGKLDHLKLSPAMAKIYAIYVAGHLTLEDLQKRIREDIHPADLWAIITDVKTCKSIRELEPFNKHYRGQLGFYQDLVSDVLLIPIENIRCRILVSDKGNNDYKKCELFEYSQASLNELKGDVEAWAGIWWSRQSAGQRYISAKEKQGWHQTCFTCSECRFCPFSLKPGEPVMVTEARFSTGDAAKPLAEEINTADAVLDY